MLRLYEAAVEDLVDYIRETLKYKHCLSIQEELGELKAQLEKLRQLMPSTSDDKETMRELKVMLEESTAAVGYLYMNLCILRPLSKSYWIKESGWKILRAKNRVKRLNEEILNRGNQVLHSDQPLINLDPAQQSSMATKVEEESVIGFDGAAKEVVALLTTGAKHLEAISIVGMLGLGKTALAKKVYKDAEVDYEYKIRAFVYVSGGYDVRQVLLEILTYFTQIDDKVSDRMNDEQLEKYVYQQLEGKQYLVVLDDIRDPEDWDRFKGAFPNNRDKMCRVLITTRNEAVARSANPTNPDSFYKLNFLPLESSRELFRWKVFGENSCHMSLQEYEEGILLKCDGLPLALVAVASMLVKHPDRIDWWMKVVSSLEHYIARDVEIATILIKQAYEHMPDQLKPCFLYLSMFPENFEIPTWKLFRLWIAEGFLGKREGVFLNLESLAEQYLQVLVDRDLVMVSRMRSNGRIGKCVINGIIYEFCKEKAAEENIFFEIDKYNLHSDVQYPLMLCRVCLNKVSVLDYMSWQYSNSIGEFHSFLNYSRGETKVKPKNVSRITKTCRVLKVLELQSLHFTVFPDKICCLVFLKYLAISGRFSSLLSTLSKMRNLETLIVKTTCDTLKFRVDIWKMPNFRHLHTNAATSFPCRVTPEFQKSEDNEYVQTLCYVSPESLKKGGIDQTTKLKKLGIRGRLSKLFKANGSESRLLPYFQKLECLENLKLLNEDLMVNKFPGLPPRGAFPKKLAKLTLSNTRMNWKEMYTLGEIENLEVLKLKEHAFVGEQWKTEKGGFLRLKHLHIGRSDLMVWEASSDHFPQLKSLEINECHQLRRIPHNLADISSFQSVLLHRSTSPGVTYSLKRIRLVKFLQAKVADKRKVFEISVFPPQE